MSIVLVVIVSSLSILMVLNYTYNKRQSEAAMNRMLDNATDMQLNTVDNNYFNGEEDSRYGSYDGTIFVIVTDAHGNMLSMGVNHTTSLAVDGDMIDDALDYALHAKKDTGTVSGYNLRYMKRAVSGGYQVAIADRSQELSDFYHQLRIYLIGAVVLLLFAFLLIYFMSDRAIAPVAKSIKDQKRFIADASHELKTPLTVILANTDIMATDMNATIGQRKKWLDSTKSEADRMSELVNDMLYLARADAGIQPQFNFKRVSLSDIVDDCVLTCESLAFENRVHLKAKIANDVHVIADEGKIKQVIMVLIENAMKYVNPGGTISVTLKTQPVRMLAKVSIVNTGEPIPDEKREHLFDRFYRADEARTREKGGYGLGLSIAQSMVEQHNGEIGLDYSDAERGTCFAVELPLETNALRSPKIAGSTDTKEAKLSRAEKRAMKKADKKAKAEAERKAKLAAEQAKKDAKAEEKQAKIDAETAKKQAKIDAEQAKKGRKSRGETGQDRCQAGKEE